MNARTVEMKCGVCHSAIDCRGPDAPWKLMCGWCGAVYESPNEGGLELTQSSIERLLCKLWARVFGSSSTHGMTIGDLPAEALRRHLKATILAVGEDSMEAKMIRQELRKREDAAEI